MEIAGFRNVGMIGVFYHYGDWGWRAMWFLGANLCGK